MATFNSIEKTLSIIYTILLQVGNDFTDLMKVVEEVPGNLLPSLSLLVVLEIMGVWPGSCQSVLTQDCWMRKSRKK